MNLITKADDERLEVPEEYIYKKGCELFRAALRPAPSLRPRRRSGSWHRARRALRAGYGRSADHPPLLPRPPVVRLHRALSYVLFSRCCMTSVSTARI